MYYLGQQGNFFYLALDSSPDLEGLPVHQSFLLPGHIQSGFSLKLPVYGHRVPLVIESILVHWEQLVDFT